MTVRQAEPGDGERLAVIHVASWQATYRGIFPDRFLDAMDPTERVEAWRRRIGHPDVAVLLVEDGGEPVGFASLGPAEERAEQPVGELYAIYLLPGTWRRGLGRRLLEEAERLLAVRYPEAILWVLEANSRARRFYEACGWIPDGGTRTEPIFGANPLLIRYRKTLRQRPASHEEA
ncbi:MAG: N-acetyltransferase [Acidimicrobiia bacterium]|nr:MAG: N-acetyltransferase [Acidimicrobiia bacterium]